MHSYTPMPFSRRSTLKAAGWSAPIVLASAAVPAYAASSPIKELSADYGLFAQVINTNLESPNATYVGVHSAKGATSSSTGDAQYADGSVTGTSGLAANGEGDFTPGGTLADGSYGGTGFWASAPYDLQTRQPVDGTTILTANSSFVLTYTFTFNDEYAITDPLLWSANSSNVYVEEDTTSTSRLSAINGAPFRVVMSAPVVDGMVWTATATLTLTEDLIITNGGAQQNLGQVLASQHAVYHDMAQFLVSARVTIAPSSSAQLALSADGYESKVVPLVGQSVTAELPINA